MTTPTPDRTPTGDLRERLAHAMAHAPGTVYQACNDDMYLRIADGVMPVVEAWAAENFTGTACSAPAQSPETAPGGEVPGDLRERLEAALRAGRCCSGHIPRIAAAIIPEVQAALPAAPWTGVCVECGELIEDGDLITWRLRYAPQGPIHEECR